MKVEKNKLKITLLTDNPHSWIMPYCNLLVEYLKKSFDVRWIDTTQDLKEGDIAIFLSCEKIIPKEFSLLQNYPNPFNPITMIKYVIPKSEYVQLKVYNAIGKIITILVDIKQEAGEYEVQWDGSNYPSGIYFYKLSAGDFTLLHAPDYFLEIVSGGRFNVFQFANTPLNSSPVGR